MSRICVLVTEDDGAEEGWGSTLAVRSVLLVACVGGNWKLLRICTLRGGQRAN